MFEFDPDKSQSNLEKHGINFQDAQVLWEGTTVTLTLPHSEENRSLVIGRIQEKFWSAIITFRNENVRIISVRRSRKNEKEIWQAHHKS